jgi:putative endonuclease
MQQEEKFFVYILQSLKDFSFYVGQCDDLDRRMSKHFDGFSKYTASKRPLRLVYFEKVKSRTNALQREKEIKSKKSRVSCRGNIAGHGIRVFSNLQMTGSTASKFLFVVYP